MLPTQRFISDYGKNRFHSNIIMPSLMSHYILHANWVHYFFAITKLLSNDLYWHGIFSYLF